MHDALVRPEFITFTGVDDQTPISRMRELSAVYPIEWGVLFSPQRQGDDPRYPSRLALGRILASGLRLAAHLCGGYSVRIMDGMAPEVPVDLAAFSRVQVNHSSPDATRIAAFSERCGRRCIAQARGGEFPADDRVDWLFDASGGRGMAPLFWPPHPGRTVGYAGGLGPGNVASSIEAIRAHGPYWIDMESRVRTNDVFDLARVESVCQTVYGIR